MKAFVLVELLSICASVLSPCKCFHPSKCFVFVEVFCNLWKCFVICGSALYLWKCFVFVEVFCGLWKCFVFVEVFCD